MHVPEIGNRYWFSLHLIHALTKNLSDPKELEYIIRQSLLPHVG